MLINATHWSDMLTSPATLCAIALLGLFFVGELVTFFCATVPRQASAWLRSTNLVIVGRTGGWAPHRVGALDPADHAVALDDTRSWVTIARTVRPKPGSPAIGPAPEHLMAFARWLAERGRLAEWPRPDSDSRS